MDEALQLAEETGERWIAAELHRHKGRLLLRQGQAEAAEKLYCKALNIVREQQARLWELRAAVSLAWLRCDQGRRTEARNLLTPIYSWFTEGFDTSPKRRKGAARWPRRRVVHYRFDHQPRSSGARNWHTRGVAVAPARVCLLRPG